MAIPFNFFEESWKKEMNELLEKAKNDRQSYLVFIDKLEDRYNKNPEDPHYMVRAYVGKLRKMLWPESQFEKEPSLLGVISNKTFEDLRQKPNYDKFVQHVRKIENSNY